MHWVCMDLGTQMLCFLTSVAVVWSGPVWAVNLAPTLKIELHTGVDWCNLTIKAEHTPNENIWFLSSVSVIKEKVCVASIG